MSALAVKGYLRGLGESCPETPGGKYHWGLQTTPASIEAPWVRCEWVVGCIGASQGSGDAVCRTLRRCLRSNLVERLRSEQLSIPTEAVVIAKSVFDMVSAIDPKIPIVRKHHCVDDFTGAACSGVGTTFVVVPDYGYVSRCLEGSDCRGTPACCFGYRNR